MKEFALGALFLLLFAACSPTEEVTGNDTAATDDMAQDVEIVDDPSDQSDPIDQSDQLVVDDIVPDDLADADLLLLDEMPDVDADIDTVWTPVAPKRETQGIWTIVWLSGTPYEMGYQHGQLLHDQLKKGIDESQYVSDLKWQISLAGTVGLDNFASLNSYPDIKQECQGMVDAAGDIGWTMELCLFVNFGDVMVEALAGVIPARRLHAPGCSQMMVTGDATADGRTYHGRILDWGEVDYLLWFPTIFVRQPSDGLPHVYIGFPGNLSPYSGMNVAGLSMASNETDPYDGDQNDLVGRSHVQMLGQLLKKSTTLDEAITFVQGEDHMSVEQFGITDANLGRAGVFEMTSTAVAVREMDKGALWMTNHFVAPATQDLDADPIGDSSRRRFQRYAELVPQDGADTRYGTFEPSEIIKVLRDRVNPETGSESPVGTFDDDSSIATNGAIYAMVFDPGSLHFWVAAGTMPVPEQEFTGFSLGALLNWPGATPVDPAVIP